MVDRVTCPIEQCIRMLRCRKAQQRSEIEFSIMWNDRNVFSCRDLFWNRVEPLWKGQECLTKVARFGTFPCTIPYKLCLFYPSWQATSSERPPSLMAFIEGFHCIARHLLWLCHPHQLPWCSNSNWIWVILITWLHMLPKCIGFGTPWLLVNIGSGNGLLPFLCQTIT